MKRADKKAGAKRRGYKPSKGREVVVLRERRVEFARERTKRERAEQVAARDALRKLDGKTKKKPTEVPALAVSGEPQALKLSDLPSPPRPEVNGLQAAIDGVALLKQQVHLLTLDDWPALHALYLSVWQARDALNKRRLTASAG